MTLTTFSCPVHHPNRDPAPGGFPAGYTVTPVPVMDKGGEQTGIRKSTPELVPSGGVDDVEGEVN
jgi:hypothetical protein